MSYGIADPEVAAVFDLYPPDLRTHLLALRALILETARQTPDTGTLVETLKWGQPSYLTEKPKSGTTVRIDADKSHGSDYALYVPCSTSLIQDWKERYPALTYGGTRSVHFRLGVPLPAAELAHCIALAMTYHRKRR